MGVEVAASDTLLVLLIASYAGVTGFATVQLGRIWAAGHRIWSKQVTFLVLAWLFTVLRIGFFARQTPVPQGVSLLLKWLPMALQFANYGLLVMYFAQVSEEPAVWATKAEPASTLYTASTLGCLVLTLVFIMMYDETAAGAASTTSESVIQPTVLVAAGQIFAGTMFLALALTLAYYASRMVTTLRSGKGVHLVGSGSDVRALTAMAWGLTAINTSRFGFDIASAFVPKSRTDDVIDGFNFAAYFLWEIIPTLWVLFHFRKVPKRASSAIGPLAAGHTRGSVSRRPLLTDSLSASREGLPLSDSEFDAGTSLLGPRPAAPHDIKHLPVVLR